MNLNLFWPGDVKSLLPRAAANLHPRFMYLGSIYDFWDGQTEAEMRPLSVLGQIAVPTGDLQWLIRFEGIFSDEIWEHFFGWILCCGFIKLSKLCGSLTLVIV